MIFKNNPFQHTSNNERLEKVHKMLSTGFDVQENLTGYKNQMEFLKASDKKSLCKLGDRKIVQFINSFLTD